MVGGSGIWRPSFQAPQDRPCFVATRFYCGNNGLCSHDDFISQAAGTLQNLFELWILSGVKICELDNFDHKICQTGTVRGTVATR